MKLARMQGWQDLGGGFVEEMQGAEGSYQFPELLLQRIWERGGLNWDGAFTEGGESVACLHAGQWNHGRGPDFRGASLRLNGRELSGDVELHLRAGDWERHGHADDPAHAGVVLHGVLFPPGMDWRTRHGDRTVPTLVLLPLLPFDLESYAVDDAAERLAGTALGSVAVIWQKMDEAARNLALERHAEQRWRGKVEAASASLRCRGWVEACHVAAMEAMGRTFNHGVMREIAVSEPFAAWSAGCVEPDAVYARWGGFWRRGGLRPLNHPRLRLEQYAAWCRTRGDWPARLLEWSLDPDAGALRRSLCGNVVPQGRWETLVCDALLPLRAAQRPSLCESCRELWIHWRVDNCCEQVRALLRAGRERGLASAQRNGRVQGLLGWLKSGEGRGQKT